jgi:hypothetical protein
MHGDADRIDRARRRLGRLQAALHEAYESLLFVRVDRLVGHRDARHDFGAAQALEGDGLAFLRARARLRSGTRASVACSSVILRSSISTETMIADADVATTLTLTMSALAPTGTGSDVVIFGGATGPVLAQPPNASAVAKRSSEVRFIVISASSNSSCRSGRRRCGC